MADDLSVQAHTDQPVITLWPNGAPDPLPGVGPEQSYQWSGGGGAPSTMLRNISEPTLTVFRADPAKANGTGVIIAPGGGWRILAWTHEGIDLAEWFAARGVTAFLLKYRVAATVDDPAEFERGNAEMNSRGNVFAKIPADKLPRTLAELVRAPGEPAGRPVAAVDGRQALALVRERAAEYGVKPDRIGMVGFSAGAFLAADVAMQPGGAPLAFVAPIYGGETQGLPAPADAPPLFTCIAQDDRMLFKVVERMFVDWSNADRPAEIHIFPKGGHGFGMTHQGKPVDRWLGLMEAWLQDLGYLAA
jgi:acetyl esterase/lipase